jgi:hypothetical protein
MAAERKSKNIGGRKVEATQFTGSTANKMFVRFAQCYSRGMITCTPDEWQKFCEDFFQYSSIDGIPITNKENFDNSFTGAIGFLMRMVEFVAEVNGFLDSGDSGNTTEHETPKTSK